MITTNFHDAIKALKVGDKIEEILNDADYKLKIHSNFKNAVNLINSNDWIITLLPESYCAGPQAIVLTQEEFSRFKALNLRVMDEFHFESFIDIKSAAVVYRKRPNGSIPINMAQVKANKEYFEGLLKQSGNKKGMLGQDNIYSKYAAPILEEFSGFFVHEEYKQAGDKLAELVGLGPGLTPSGDDFIVGVLASFIMLGVKEEIISHLTKPIINKGKSKTNIISFNMLRQGAQGGFLEWIEDMTLSVIYKNEEEIEKSFKNMMKIGSSSGSDISAGILFGMEQAVNLF